MPAGGEAEAYVGATMLCRGEFEITACVEETWLAGDQEAEEREGRPPPESETLLDDPAALGPRERRVWHTRRPCIVVVRDPPDC